MNKISLLDNNFVLLRNSTELHSQISVLHYHSYKNETEIFNYLELHKDSIQVIAGEGKTPFGKSQKPLLTDYPDEIDTMLWLQNISKID
jgi:hypothetical protein